MPKAQKPHLSIRETGFHIQFMASSRLCYWNGDHIHNELINCKSGTGGVYHNRLILQHYISRRYTDLISASFFPNLGSTVLFRLTFQKNYYTQNTYHEEWREGSGPMTARQPGPKGAKTRIHEASDGKRFKKTAFWAVFQFQGPVTPVQVIRPYTQ